MDQSEKELNTSATDRRLWIGNLDPRVTEYQLLKLVQKYGCIEKFDLLFHRTGPLVGQPRGYAFVTYSNKVDATRAKEILDNLLVGQRKILVTWAYSMSNEEMEKPRNDVHIPALAMTKNDSRTDRLTQIQAIEAKLKLMERKSQDELQINETVANKTPILPPVQKLDLNPPPVKTFIKKQDRYNKPYSRHKSKR